MKQEYDHLFAPTPIFATDDPIARLSTFEHIYATDHNRRSIAERLLPIMQHSLESFKVAHEHFHPDSRSDEDIQALQKTLQTLHQVPSNLNLNRSGDIRRENVSNIQALKIPIEKMPEVQCFFANYRGHSFQFLIRKKDNNLILTHLDRGGSILHPKCGPYHEFTIKQENGHINRSFLKVLGMMDPCSRPKKSTLEKAFFTCIQNGDITPSNHFSDTDPKKKDISPFKKGICIWGNLKLQVRFLLSHFHPNQKRAKELYKEACQFTRLQYLICIVADTNLKEFNDVDFITEVMPILEDICSTIVKDIKKAKIIISNPSKSPTDSQPRKDDTVYIDIHNQSFQVSEDSPIIKALCLIDRCPICEIHRLIIRSLVVEGLLGNTSKQRSQYLMATMIKLGIPNLSIQPSSAEKNDMQSFMHKLKKEHKHWLSNCEKMTITTPKPKPKPTYFTSLTTILAGIWQRILKWLHANNPFKTGTMDTKSADPKESSAFTSQKTKSQTPKYASKKYHTYTRKPQQS